MDTSELDVRLSKDGFYVLPGTIQPAACQGILDKVRRGRRFGPELFLDEASFDANPIYKGVNPRPGRNLFDTLHDDVRVVLDDVMLRSCLSHLLGEDYEHIHHKFVCGIPEHWIPQWLRQRIYGNPVNNLGPYVRPEYRDITYFYGIDFHQDIIDWPDRLADFVTVYVYLHPVSASDAPLHILRGSHLFGATEFPHRLTLQRDTQEYRYEAAGGRQCSCECVKLMGPAGTVAVWHSATLHGTQPDKGDHERISLRLLFGKRNPGRQVGIDVVNDAIQGPLSLSRTRRDLSADGAAVLRANVINSGLSALSRGES